MAALFRGGRLADLDVPQNATRADREGMASALGKVLAEGRLVELTPARVQSALASLKAGGRSLATCNHHRSAIRGFSRWAYLDGRLAEDVLTGVTGFNAKEDRRHDCRTLGLDELRMLIEAVHNGPAYRHMSGPDRAICSRLAAATGLRYAEIKSITPGAFVLDGDHPTVTAVYTKNGEPAVLPLHHDLAADLSRWLAGKPDGSTVFPLPDKGATMLYVGLKAAGIVYRDAAGLVFDFHALRCQCATLADQAGVSPRVVQRLMRHSTLELTGRYTRPRMVDIEGAASSIPSLRPRSPASESAAAAGVDGQHIDNCFASHLPRVGDGSGRDVTATGGTDEKSPVMASGRKPFAVTGLGT